MDQSHPKNPTYESISSSLPTYESFASQQNNTMEDENVDVEAVDENKRKRKAPSKPRKTTSECWKYFDAKFEPDENGLVIKMAYCKWCDAVLKADSKMHGTRHLNTHYANCDNNPDVEKIRKQKKLAFKKNIGEIDEGGSSIGTLETWKYDEKVIKKSLIELIVLAELPFKFVEHPAFIKFSTNMQPRFNMPSRFTIARDVSKFFLDERKSLLNYLSNKATTVHLTTDTWTSSCKRMNFMVLTAHFIDDDWVMNKRIINFRPIYSHRGVDIGRALLECINGWGIKNVMTITVDNIASNDKALEYLVENLPNKYDGGKHFHIRCMAHIFNLVVKNGLKTFNKEEFDILNWWKVNSPRFPIVSRMAKDILCIQASTVASESAFSASGRVLDPYRNSLAPSIVEALVCTQDWIRTSSRNITLDTLEDLMKDDEVAKEIQEALEKQKGEHGNSRML